MGGRGFEEIASARRCATNGQMCSVCEAFQCVVSCVIRKVSKMKNIRMCFVGAVLCVFSVSSVVNAGTITIGPFPDFKGFTDRVTWTIDTCAKTDLFPLDQRGIFGPNFYGHFHHFVNIHDRHTFTVHSSIPIPVFAASYIQVTYPDFWFFNNPTQAEFNAFWESNAPVRIVDVWAKDLNPSGDAIVLSGFDGPVPGMVPEYGEQFFGNSGTGYVGSSTTTTVGGLGSELPGFDMSAFAGADPEGIVYISSAIIPASDVPTVPEPSSLVLAVIGGLAFASRAFQSRKEQRRAN